MQLPPQLSHARLAHNPTGPNTPNNTATLQRPLFVRLAASVGGPGGGGGWGPNGLRPLMLSYQYRVHPTISRLASELFYGGRLRDGITAQVCFYVWRLDLGGGGRLLLLHEAARAPGLSTSIPNLIQPHNDNHRTAPPWWARCPRSSASTWPRGPSSRWAGSRTSTTPRRAPSWRWVGNYICCCDCWNKRGPKTTTHSNQPESQPTQNRCSPSSSARPSRSSTPTRRTVPKGTGRQAGAGGGWRR